MKVTKTLKIRIKDKHAKQLSAMARSVNFVWNTINELSHRSIRERGRFFLATIFKTTQKALQRSGRNL